MSEEEKQAIEYWKTHLEILHCNTQIASEHYIKVLLDLVEKQQKEIEEKEKVIDEMAKELVDLPIPISQEENVLFFNSWDVKRFFYKKIEKK